MVLSGLTVLFLHVNILPGFKETSAEDSRYRKI